MDNNPIMYELGQTHKIFKENVRREVLSHNIPITYFNILKFLNQNKDREINQVDLCEYLGIKPSSVSVNLVNMEQDNLIERRKSSTDTRKTVVVITDKGYILLKEALKAYKVIDKKIDSIITKDEEEALRKILKKIREGLKGDTNETNI